MLWVNFCPFCNIQGRQQERGVWLWLTPKFRRVREPEIVVH